MVNLWWYHYHMRTKKNRWVPSPSDLVEQQRLSTEIESLKASTQHQFDEVVYWLRENANALCCAYVGDPGRLFSKGSSHTVDVKVEGDKCFIIANCIWHYDNLQSKHPDLKKLSEHLSGVCLTADTENDYLLRVKLQFDTEKWPFLATSVVYKKLYFAKLGPGDNHDAKGKALNDAALLVGRFFPEMNMDVVDISIDLGMFESFETFLSWFNPPPPGLRTNTMPSDFL